MKLDLGCGANKKEGCVGIDNATESMTGKQFAPDMIADLNLGIPVPPNSCEYIYSSHALEHFKNPHFIMDEIYRVCKDGALVDIIIPLYCDWLADHLTMFYPDWFERNIDMTKFQIITKTTTRKRLSFEMMGRHGFIEMHIKFRVKK